MIEDRIVLFRVLFNEDRTRIETNTEHDVMGWGVMFPSGGCYVEWNREAYDPDDRLDDPHVSIYGGFDDVEQGTGGDVDIRLSMEVDRQLPRGDDDV